MPRTGRPPYQPNEEHRNTVKTMAAAGFTHESIARCLGITEPTLRKNYRHELSVSGDMATAKIAGMLFQAASRGEPWAVCFWLKTRGRWREASPQDTPLAAEVFKKRIEIVYVNAPPQPLLEAAPGETIDVDLPRAVGEE